MAVHRLEREAAAEVEPSAPVSGARATNERQVIEELREHGYLLER